MKVLILSLTVGQGHNSSSKALAEYLGTQGVSVTILDTYKYLSRLVGTVLDKGYIAILRMSPKRNGKMFENGLKASAKNRHKKSFPYMFHIRVKRKMLKYIDSLAPDVIVCPHVFTAMLTTQLRAIGMDMGIKTYGIVTDFTFHPFWEHTDIDHYVLASELMVEPGVALGLEREKLIASGIPVRECFSRDMDAKAARELFGLPHAPTFLVLGGSMGFGKMPEVVHELCALGFDKNILFVAGSNKRLLDTAKHEFPPDVKVFGYVDSISELMDAADFIITKPGGITVSEVLSKRKPLILTDPIPGGEERNLRLLVEHGLAVRADGEMSVSRAVLSLMDDPQTVEAMLNAQEKYGKRHSAKALGDIIIGSHETREVNNE